MIVPGVVVDWTMAISLPLKAAWEVPLYESWFVESPASRPTRVPGPVTETAIDVVGLGRDDALCVDDVHLDVGQVASVRLDGGPVGAERQLGRRAGRLHRVGRDDRTALGRLRLQRARREGHRPLKVRGRAGHGLRAQRRAVEEELDAVRVGIGPHGDGLAGRPAGPVHRHDVDHRRSRGAPLALIEIEDVLREAGGVDGAEVRALRRPAVGRRLADVIPAGPDELAGDVGARVDAGPRPLRAGAPGDDAVVVRRALVVAPVQDVRGHRRLVDAAAPDCGRPLAGEELPARVARVEGVVNVRRVVEADDVLHRRPAVPGGPGVGLADRPRAVLGLDGRDERLRDGGVVVVRISLPMLQMMIPGWLRSRATMAPMSVVDHWLKKRA